MIGVVKKGVIERIEPAVDNPEYDPNCDFPPSYKPAVACVRTDDGYPWRVDIPWGKWTVGDAVELVYLETAFGADWHMRKDA